MARKLFILCASLAFCVLLTNASIYRTVVEFEEDDVTNPRHGGGQQGQGQQQRCQKEFQQSQHLQACQRWIQKQMRQGRPGRHGGIPAIFDENDVDFDFEDDFENPRGSQQRPPLLQQCCQELRQEDPVCVCPTLQRAAQAVSGQGQQGKQGQGPYGQGQQGQQGQGPYGQGQQGQQGQGQGQGQHQVRQIFQTARNLPQVCNIRQVGVCPFQRPTPYYY